MSSKIILAIASLLITATLIEAAARIVLPPPAIITVTPIEALPQKGIEVQVQTSINTAANDLYLNTPAGRRLRPNTRAIVKNHETCGCDAEIVTNSFGFRGPEISAKTKPRILFLGDSITFADYVKEDETWVRKVQQRAAERGLDIETINGGIWAVGLANILSILVEPGIRTEPDVVVVAAYLNDVENSPGIRYQPLPPYLHWSRAAFYLTRPFRSQREISDYATVPFAEINNWQAATRTMFPPPIGNPANPREQFYKAIDTFFFDWGSGFSAGAWQHMKPLFAEMKRLSEVHHFRLAFMLFPVADQVYQEELFDFPQQQLKSISEELSVPYLDVLPFVRSVYRTSQNKIFYDWCHYTPYGNDRLADEILNFLINEHLIAN